MLQVHVVNVGVYSGKGVSRLVCVLGFPMEASTNNCDMLFTLFRHTKWATQLWQGSTRTMSTIHSLVPTLSPYVGFFLQTMAYYCMVNGFHSIHAGIACGIGTVQVMAAILVGITVWSPEWSIQYMELIWTGLGVKNVTCKSTCRFWSPLFSLRIGSKGEDSV